MTTLHTSLHPQTLAHIALQESRIRLIDQGRGIPGGRESFSLSALSESVTHRVYRYREHLTLNFVTSPDFLIFTERASFRLAVSRKSLISLICLGCKQ